MNNKSTKYHNLNNIPNHDSNKVNNISDIYADININNHNFQNDEEQEIENNENEEEEEDEDDRLIYTLITLDLGNLIHIFEENNISFIDMLLLTKEDLKELQLSLYQRNRIYHFSLLFNKYAKNYSIGEISDFFSFNKQFIFNSSIYDRVNVSVQNINIENENNNYIQDENNLEMGNDNFLDNQNYYNGGIGINNNNDNNNIYNKKNINTDKNKNNKNNQFNNANKDNQKISNNNYNYFVNNDKKQPIKRNMINNSNPPTYYKENSKQYYNKKSNSAMSNYLSIKKDTDNFLKKISIQKEESEKKRDKASSLINKQNQAIKYQYKKLDEFLLSNKNNNITEYLKEENEVIENDIDINEEYQKMLDKIDEIEQMKMDYNSYSHLNQIKEYINKKGDNILIGDIKRINGEIDKMIEILNEKEKLNKALENCNLKINNKKEMINNIDKFEDNNNEEMINLIKGKNIKKEKEKETKVDKNSEENFGGNKFVKNNENKKEVEEVVEVEEEYDYDNENQQQNKK